MRKNAFHYIVSVFLHRKIHKILVSISGGSVIVRGGTSRGGSPYFSFVSVHFPSPLLLRLSPCTPSSLLFPSSLRCKPSSRVSWRQQGLSSGWLASCSALHGMPARIATRRMSVRLSVRPSVRLSNVWIVTKREKDLSRFYTIRKII